MAYTIVQSPAAFSSFNSPLWHVVNSSNNINADFRYLFQIHVMGSINPVVTLRITPDENGEGVVDVARVVRSYVVNYFELRDSTFSPFTIDTDDIRIDYTVFYGEEYSLAGVFGQYPGLTSGSHTTFNSYADDTPGDDPFTTISSYADNWLTDRPIPNIFIPRDGTNYLSYFNPGEDDLVVLTWEVDEDGVPTGGIVPFATTDVPAANRLVVLNLNRAYLQAATWTPGNIFSPSIAGYGIAISRDAGLTYTDPVVVRWMCEAKTDATTLSFLNMHGGFDSYSFSSPTRRSVEFERRSYEKNPTLTSDVDIIQNYHVAHNWTRKIDTGFIDDATHNWLMQLVASPQVYLHHEGGIYPVVIKTTRWNEKITRFDKMYNLELEIEMGRKVVSQSR